MCANVQVIGVFAFKKNVQISSNFVHFEPKKEHLECGQFVESSSLLAVFSMNSKLLSRTKSCHPPCPHPHSPQMFLVESFFLLLVSSFEKPR